MGGLGLGGDDRPKIPRSYGCAGGLCRALIAGPHVLAVILRPYPARANAVIPPTAVPEVAAVSKREVCTVSMSGRDVCTGSRSNHDVSWRELSRRDHSASTTDVCRREVPRRDGCG